MVIQLANIWWGNKVYGHPALFIYYCNHLGLIVSKFPILLSLSFSLIFSLNQNTTLELNASFSL